MLLSSFPRFSPVLCPGIIVRRCRKSPSYICISVKLDPFRCPARDRKSPPQRRISSLNICGKEVDLARNLFHKQRLRHQKSTNIQQSFRLGRRANGLSRRRILSAEIGDVRSRLALFLSDNSGIESANEIMFDIKK